MVRLEDGSLVPYVSKEYDPYEPMSDAEAKELGRSFHCTLETVATFVGRGAESHARKRAESIPDSAVGKSGIVVQGEGKHRGAYLAVRMIPIGYKSNRKFTS